MKGLCSCRPRRALLNLAAGLLILGLAGCSRSTVAGKDPISDMRNPRLNERQRIEAINTVWAQAEAGDLDRVTAREELKTVAWSPGWPREMRLTALRALAGDQTEKGKEDTRNLVRLMLPREPDAAVTGFLCDTAVAGGWKETTPALVRSLSRRWPDVPDEQRPEYRAIRALNGGLPVQEVVYSVFLNPPEEGGAFGIIPADRVRADAWDLLNRVDADGSVRARLLLDTTGETPAPVADMRAALNDLRCLPLTGDELTWLASLRDAKVQGNRAWWDQTAATIAGLSTEKTGKLQLRHLEPIRWSGLYRPEWLTATREQLLDDLRLRLDRRQLHQRKRSEGYNWTPPPEKLAHWASRLTWADALTILVIDDAVREPAVADALFAQAQMDTDDRTAEYGGLLRSAPGRTGAAAILYPPRPGARRGDRQFVASSDMIAQGDHALAHYHFHVQDLRNSQYAGPSPDDLAYAARLGRSCLVITSVASDAMNVDYYQPDGSVIDLGEIRRR